MNAALRRLFIPWFAAVLVVGESGFAAGEESTGRRDFALFADQPVERYLAMRMFAAAGVPAPEVELIGLTVKGTWAGWRCRMEPIDKEFARRFPEWGAVGIWRCERDAPLAFRGTDPRNYEGYAYRDSGGSGGDGNTSAIIALCQAMARGDGDTDTVYEKRVAAAIDVEEWIRFFAVNSLIANRTPGITTTQGKGYFLVRRSTDSRFLILPGEVSDGFQTPYFPITANQVEAVRRILSSGVFGPRYRSEVGHLCDVLFSPESCEGLLEEVRGVADAGLEARLRCFFAARPHEVRAQLFGRIAIIVRDPGPRYLIPVGAAWKLYNHPDPPSGSPGEWTSPDYDDTRAAGWIDASMPMGHSPQGLLGEKAKGTFIRPWADSDNEVVFHVRRRFLWRASRPPRDLRLSIRANAGWVAYLNGVEVARDRMPEGPPGPATLALAVDPKAYTRTIDLQPFANHIRKDENVIAIESHMASRSDPERVLDAALLEGDRDMSSGQTDAPRLRFTGKAPVPPVAYVKVQGREYPVDTYRADWVGEVDLVPGTNTVVFSGIDARGDAVTTSTITWDYQPSASRRAPHGSK